jgi:hypothetical protein
LRDKEEAVVIYSDGSSDHVVAAGKTFTLDELRAAIDNGWIEDVPIPPGSPARGLYKNVFADEDGHMKKLPLNELATALVGRLLVGPVLLVETRRTTRIRHAAERAVKDPGDDYISPP